MTEQTLRPFNPSWADKLASYMLDHTSGSPEARHFVGGMMGTTGLGKQGMGLVDAVPVVGQALQAQEAYQNNDLKGMAMAMLPLAPAPAKSYAGALGRMARNEDGWIAWHGSPHKYDRVDLSKVGTGEGHQAYGHGYYVAEHPDVAKGYQKMLAQDTLNDSELDAYQALEAGGWNRDAAHADLNRGVARLQENLKSFPDVPHDPVAYKAQKDAARRLIDEWSAAGGMPADKQGFLYKLDIKPEQERFLAWDKPLSEQHPSVREALSADRQYSPDMNGAEFYHAKADRFYGKANQFDILPETVSAAYLARKGIPGISYLDAGSRGAGSGTRNFVLFDPNDVQILERNGMPLGMPPAKTR